LFIFFAIENKRRYGETSLPEEAGGRSRAADREAGAAFCFQRLNDERKIQRL
jgi:hypothetical protein